MTTNELNQMDVFLFFFSGELLPQPSVVRLKLAATLHFLKYVHVCNNF